MFDKVLELFRLPDTEKASISAELAAAALMFEVIWADHDIKAEELRTMQRALSRLFDLPEDQMHVLIEETQTKSEKSVGVHAFTRTLNEHLSAEQKFDVVKALWAVAFADNTLDRFEEHTIRRIADLLYVPHSDFIRAKLAARDATADS